MKVGITICDLTWPEGAAGLAANLGATAQKAEEAGVSSIWLMDHFFQIPVIGPPEREMLEAYTALGWIAAKTSRASVGALVTGVTYRHPGLLAKQVTTLDVLSGGRASLGLGCAWFEEEHTGLGVDFPPLGARFEMLEETLQICRKMFEGDETPFEGRHYQLARTLNSPPPVSRPRIPILLGGGGEKKTLRMVAQYGDASNVMPLGVDLVRRKMEVIDEHCADLGRDPSEIHRTLLMHTRPTNAEAAKTMADELADYAAAGIQEVILPMGGPRTDVALDCLGTDLLPLVEGL